MKIESRRLADDEAGGLMLDLVAYWTAKRRGRRFPAKIDMRPEELKPYLGNLCILERVGGSAGFRYRLVGSRLADATGHNATGLDPRDIPPPEYGAAIHRDLLAALAAAEPLLQEIVMQRGYTRVSYQRATLPLAGDGEHIDHLLTFSFRPEVFTQLFRRFDVQPAG